MLHREFFTAIRRSFGLSSFGRRSLGRRSSATLLPLVLLLVTCVATACFSETAEKLNEVEDEVAEDEVAQDEVAEDEVAEDEVAEDEVAQEETLDETPYETHAEEAEALRRLLQIEPGDAVADVGAGDGDWTEDLAGFVGESGTVWATEVDEELVDDLKSLAEDLPQIRPVLGDQDSIGLPDGCCDAVLLRLVYHHFTDPAPMRADLRRALKPGARLLIVDITPQTSWRELEDVPDRGGHGIPIQQLIEEMESDGFRAVETVEAWGDEEDEFAVVFMVQ